MPRNDLVSSVGLFQSRTTNTPGGVGPVPAGTLAVYDPAADPRQIAASVQGLTPEERQTLMKAWASTGKGFITVPSQHTRPDIMRHEELHDLQMKAGLDQYANQIAPLVEPGITDQIKSNPVYQQQAKAQGLTPTVADEGSAMELINYGRKGTPLQGFISSKLNPQQQKQLSQLTGGE